jgi:hypothetical protein
MRLPGQPFGIVGVLLLFAFDASGFSTHNIMITRSFDEVETVVGGTITVSVGFTNAEVRDLRGFYYTDQIPEGLSVETVSLRIDGDNIPNYRYDSGSAGEVYPGCRAFRWILETPSGFQENNPIALGSTLEIVYSVSSSEGGVFHLDEFDWVGYYAGASKEERPAFGYSEEADKKTITFRGGQLPVADAGPLQRVDGGSTVFLDGSDSYDPDGAIVAYSWSQTLGTEVTLFDPTEMNPFFTAPSVTGALVFELEVTDDEELTDTDSVIINVTTDDEQEPVADARCDQPVMEGTTVLLDGSDSHDPDGTIVAYSWEQTEGPDAPLSDTADSRSTFVAPPVPVGGMNLTFELRVTDNDGLKGTCSISIAVSDNGIMGFPPDVITTSCSTGAPIGIEVAGGGDITQLDIVDPATITDTRGDRPDNLIYGLIDTRIRTDTIGGNVNLIIYLPTPAPDGYDWFKYSPASGWQSCSGHARFNQARDRVTLELTDGGIGDDDGTPDRVIVDPSGMGSGGAGGGAAPAPSGGGGCFIETAVLGWMCPSVITHPCQRQ